MFKKLYMIIELRIAFNAMKGGTASVEQLTILREFYSMQSVMYKQSAEFVNQCLVQAAKVHEMEKSNV